VQWLYVACITARAVDEMHSSPVLLPILENTAIFMEEITAATVQASMAPPLAALHCTAQGVGLLAHQKYKNM
jgi:hypothetical protein